MQARYDALNPPALDRLLATGVELRPFSEDLLKGAAAASAQLIRDAAAEDPQYREVFEHWDAFRRKSFAWFSRAELAYANAAWST